MLSLLAAPVALAQDAIPDKCTMRHTIAAGDLTCPASGQPCLVSDDKCGMCCILNSIFTVTDWIFYLLTLFVVIMIIFGGFSIITASGDPEKAAKGRSILTYAIIGLAIALLAKLIPSLVSFIMGM